MDNSTSGVSQTRRVMELYCTLLASAISRAEEELPPPSEARTEDVFLGFAPSNADGKREEMWATKEIPASRPVLSDINTILEYMRMAVDVV